MSTATTASTPATSAAPLRVAVIVGSTRRGRAGEAIAHWFVRQAATRQDVAIDLVDLAEVRLPVVLPDFDTETVPDVVACLGARLAAADAFVVATPEYNHSFPAALKNAIDWYDAEWQAKPVAFVSYGGRGQGIRAVEQLRQVFAELHATTIRDSVNIDLADVDARGGEPTSEGAEAAAKVTIEQLVWWGRALREARQAYPYVA